MATDPIREQLEAMWNGGAAAADRERTLAHYLAVKALGEGASNESVVVPQRGARLLAEREILPIQAGGKASFAGQLNLRVAEQEMLARTGPVEVIYRDQLAVAMATVTAASLAFNPPADATIKVTAAMPASLSSLAAAGRLYARAKRRTSAPASQGVHRLEPVKDGSRTVAPEFVQFFAEVLEDTVIPARAGGTLARRAFVTWDVADGEAVRARKFTSPTGDILTLTDTQAVFTGLVEVGDWVELVGRTTAPATGFPDRVVGHYRVLAVGVQSLSLTPMRYTRTPDGGYAPELEPPFFDDRADYVVRRQLADKLVLEGGSFQGVAAGDWARAGDRIYPVEAVVPGGPLLLTDDRRAGASAPYAPAGATEAGYFELAVAAHGVTRAPDGVMRRFELRDPAGGFKGVEAGHYVEVSARETVLDPTGDASAVTGIFQVTQVVDSATVRLDNVVYTRSGDTLTAGVRRYRSFNDVAAAEAIAEVVRYPYEGVYKVAILNGVGAALEPALYGGDSGWGGEFAKTADLDEPFSDHFDLELLAIHPQGLALVGVTWPDLAPTDFVHLHRRTGAERPTAFPAVTRGSYKVAGRPRPDVLLLAPRVYTGSEPQYADTGADFFRSLTSSQRKGFLDVADARASRVLEALDSATLTVTDAEVPPLKAGDYVTVAGGSLLASGSWRVASASEREVTLEHGGKYRREGQQFLPVAIPATQLAGTSRAVTFTASVPAAAVTSVKMTATAQAFKGVRVESPFNPATADIAVVTMADETLLLLPVLAFNAIASELTLDTHPVAGSDGRYSPTSSPLASGIDAAVQVRIIRPTLVKANCELVAGHLREIVDAATLAPVDAAYAALVPEPVRQGASGPVSMRSGKVLAQALAMALAQARDVYGKAVPRRTVAKLDASRVQFSVAAETDGRDAGFGSSAFNKLRDADATGAAVLADERYHQVLAWVALADFTAVMKARTLDQVKDAYVHALLSERGYNALEAYANSKEPDLAKRAQLVAEASAGRAVALKIQSAVKRAFIDRSRTALDTAITQQLDSVLTVVKDALRDDYLNFERMFVERVKGEDLPWDNDIVAALTGLKLPFFSLGGIRGATPRERRAAVAGMIGVPADRSVRAVRRSYALTRNRQRFMEHQIADMERHRDTALDPTTKETIADWLDRVLGAYSEVENQADAMEADLGDRGVEAEEVGDGSIDPSDAGAVEGEYAEYAEAPEGDGVEEGVSLSFAVETGAVKATLTPAGAITSVAAPAREGAFKGTISNMFENDFHDYKRTGLVVALNALNSAAEGQHKDNLASIFLTDENDIRVDAIHLDVPGKFAGGAYNQFILSGVNQALADKYQVMDTLSRGFVAFAFGEHPEIWTVSGFLINDMYSDQVTKFRELWHHHLRITALAEARHKMAIRVPAAGQTIIGYGLSLQLGIDAANNESVVPFQMQVLISRTFTEPLITRVSPAFKTGPERITSLTLGNLARNPAAPEPHGAGPSGESPEAANRKAIAAIDQKITGAQNFIAKLKVDLARTQPGSAAAAKLENDIRAAENTLAGYKAEKAGLERAPLLPIPHGAVPPGVKAATDGAARAAATPQAALKTAVKPAAGFQFDTAPGAL